MSNSWFYPIAVSWFSNLLCYHRAMLPAKGQNKTSVAAEGLVSLHTHRLDLIFLIFTLPQLACLSVAPDVHSARLSDRARHGHSRSNGRHLAFDTPHGCRDVIWLVAVHFYFLPAKAPIGRPPKREDLALTS
eukprot:1187967-Prorocentrum_minimum.AAC.2